MTESSMVFQNNDVAITWDERDRRVEKPCVQCKGLTKGRMYTSDGIKAGAEPAHMACAMAWVSDRARPSLKVVRHGR